MCLLIENPIEGGFLQDQGRPFGKAQARTREALVEAMGKALDAVIVSDARGFIEHCGYRTPV
jgi:hypothetical protein